MTATLDCAALLGLTIEVNLVSPNDWNVPGAFFPSGVFTTITVHDTANTSVGADARMHRQFVANGGGTERASFNYCVDDKRAVQILREDEQDYAQGTQLGNRTSLSIETCINSDGNWSVTFNNLAKLLASLLTAHNKPLTCVVQHNYWWGKDCPGKIRHTPSAWQRLLDLTRTYMQQLEAKLHSMDEQTINGHKVSGKFLALWRADGVDRIGLPITDVFNMDFPGIGSLPVQFFERERLELQKDGTVTRGLVGVEALAHYKEAHP